MSRRILITSALPYINGVKHLGNLVGSMLPADVYSRFARQCLGPENVLAICATDEHGTPAELAALEEGLPIQDYCAKWHAIQKSLGEGFGLSFDHFGRSSSPQNRTLTQDFARTLWEAGFIEERTTRQVYSHADGRFLPDRYVTGTCPHCGYDRARGDQCENCTRVLDPVDLISPRSAISGSSDIEIRDSKHLFLKQTAFEDDLRRWIEGKRETWPHLVTSIALKWLDEGLQDRGITRDLTWGVPVNAEEWGANPDGKKPDAEGLKGKVFYVWFDAPIEYIGATWEWADAHPDKGGWERWWKLPGAADVTYVEFMGKDNVPFHTVGFPCTLMGLNKASGDPAKGWKLVDELKGFNWLNYDAGKFSTSQKRGVFMDTALEILPADYWRWYLISNAPESSDSSFTWAHFAATVNKDLADVLGNFVNRVLKFATARFEGNVPESSDWGEGENAAAAEIAEALYDFQRLLLRDHEFRQSAAALRRIWVACNGYVTAASPWGAIKEDRARAATAIAFAVNLIRLAGIVSHAFIPAKARTILDAVDPACASDGARAAAALRLPVFAANETKGRAEALAFVTQQLRELPAGHAFQVPDVLFAKIDDAQVAAWEERFRGAS